MNLDDVLLFIFEWVLVITTIELIIMCIYYIVDALSK
jgi:hypothetical protein